MSVVTTILCARPAVPGSLQGSVDPRGKRGGQLNGKKYHWAFAPPQGSSPTQTRENTPVQACSVLECVPDNTTQYTCL